MISQKESQSEIFLLPSEKVKINITKSIHRLTHLSYIQKIESEAQLVFVFGIPKSAKFVDVVNIIQENIQFQDMIIPGKSYIFAYLLFRWLNWLGNKSFVEVEDTYHTVGYKLLSAFKWLKEFSKSSQLQWIIKLDDDVIINPDCLEKFVKRLKVNESKIHCVVSYEPKPMRGTKWYQS